MSEDILRMRGITKRFPGVLALSEVDLQVKRASIHALVGENGAGKSTLMKVLSGVYAYGDYEGEIEVEGEPARFRGIRDSEEAGVVIIHQELALVDELSIAENIFLGNERKAGGIISWDRTNTEAARLMNQVGLHDNPQTLVEKIGVGKQQLVEIAKALSKDVKLLILDEPTAALNDTDSENLLQLLKALRDEGVTSIIISHKLGEVLAVADEITVLRDGQSIETLDRVGDAVTEDRIIKSMVGRDLEHLFPPHESNIGEVFFEVEDWTVHHPEHRERVIVNRANLRVARGEIVGLAGLMGAGRTEFAMSVFGRSWGTNISGSARLDGKRLKLHSVPDAIDAGLAYATEDRKNYGLHLDYDLRQNFTLPGLDRVSRNGIVNQDRVNEVAERLRTEFGVKAPSVYQLAGNLSGGNQQKIVLGKWVFTEPELLILDEPTRGIDVGAKYEIYELIQSLVDMGKGVLMISSELPELLGMCDRIYAMSAGHITGQVDRETATQEELMRLMTLETASGGEELRQ
ncbi:multiple monosaccharide ABC transporter ATP-binding protein [Glycomyces buryatensis]|uniref:Sugar ABC transporter ATP-binding protein n=1 Tax=Glycomyces buryatensis TaxID=2570927 RepID=A0A4S8QKK6_9ACTN|nr:multiple monosaccharide ABC transporter ATP-binding protein [Glycomyces buryatensis]THV41969.1 sugar ABC transporter ATP-binding protein [Glycomyces buryatensis]